MDRKTYMDLIRELTDTELLDYARELQAELDGFLMGDAYHRISFIRSENYIECVVEITKEKQTIQIDSTSIEKVESTIGDRLENVTDLLSKLDPEVHLQHGLRLYDGPRIYIYRYSRLIDWTTDQAVVDAGEIIGEAVLAGMTGGVQ